MQYEIYIQYIPHPPDLLMEEENITGLDMLSSSDASYEAQLLSCNVQFRASERKHHHHPDELIHSRFYLVSSLGEGEAFRGTNGRRKRRGVELFVEMTVDVLVLMMVVLPSH